MFMYPTTTLVLLLLIFEIRLGNSDFRSISICICINKMGLRGWWVNWWWLLNCNWEALYYVWLLNTILISFKIKKLQPHDKWNSMNMNIYQWFRVSLIALSLLLLFFLFSLLVYFNSIFYSHWCSTIIDNLHFIRDVKQISLVRVRLIYNLM